MASVSVERTSAVPWIERPTIVLDTGKRARERYADVPPEAIIAAQRLLDAIRKELPPTLRRLAPLVRLRTLSRFHREVVSLAAVVNADWRDVMLANISYELVLAALGCSTVALPTPAGPVLARNMDWFPEDLLAQASYLLRFERAGTLRFATAGWPGAVGAVTGLSSRGFAVALNAVRAPEPFNRLGYPVLLHLRRVLEDARDFDDAVKWLSRQRLAAPALFTVVGTENHQRVVIERSPRRRALRWAEGERPLIATNDYRVLFAPEASDDNILYETTCSRFNSLVRLLGPGNKAESASDERLLYVLSDPSVRQSITAQHVILRPSRQQIRLFVPRHLLN